MFKSGVWFRGFANMPSSKLKGVRRAFRLAYPALRNFHYDFRRFLTYSSAVDPRSSTAAVAARIVKEYHRIEKGLALPDPRPGFASQTVDHLITAVPRLEAEAGPCLATRGSRDALAAYAAWHDRAGAALPADQAARLRAFLDSPPPKDAARNVPMGGVVTLTRSEIAAATDFDYARFVNTRYSVRQFTGDAVSRGDIAAAVDLALKTPRVCNRESRRVHAAFAPEARARMLKFQNGNRGFGHLAGAVLMVTSDLRAFTDLGERNQCWIDGGMFAMSLAHALHARGLGTCMLNWSAPFWRDRDMRKGLPIPAHEVVITMMAVGHLPDSVDLAQSARPPVDEILSEIA